MGDVKQVMGGGQETGDARREKEANKQETEEGSLESCLKNLALIFSG